MLKTSAIMREQRKQSGFSLIELMIVVLIAGILAAIAYPSYVNSVTKSKRRAAEACLANYATYMERWYTTNLRYDTDATGATAISLPVLDCASAQSTGKNYSYQLMGTTARSTYQLGAVPQGKQATRDASCGTLTLTQTGARSDGSGGSCW